MHQRPFDSMAEYMEIDSETPPSSPIIGGSNRGSGSRCFLDIQTEGCYFTCKGPVREVDEELSPDGLIANGEVVKVLKLLERNAGDNYERCVEDEYHNFNGKFFDFRFHPEEPVLLRFVGICRRYVNDLENLLRPSDTNNFRRSDGYDNIERSDPPWKMRKEVCIFLSALAKGAHLIQGLQKLKLPKLFEAMKNSMAPVDEWSSSMKTYSGSAEGNHCSAAAHHWFHMQLELRWFYLVMSGFTVAVLDWVIDDLVRLGFSRFLTKKDNCSLNSAAAFNCNCVKEMWIMLRLVVDRVKPLGKDFWDCVVKSMEHLYNNTDDHYLFQLWFISRLAPLGKYNEEGHLYNVLQDGSANYTSNCYHYVVEVLKKTSRGSKWKVFDKMLRIVLNLPVQWGTDDRLASVAWESWVQRIGDTLSGQEHMYWTSCEKWMRLISSLTSVEDDEVDDENDFFVFIRLMSRLLLTHSDTKKPPRFLTQVYIKMPQNKLLHLNELALVRLLTLHLATCASIKIEHVNSAYKFFQCSEALYSGLLLNQKKFAHAKTLLTAHSTALLILLERRVNIKHLNVYNCYMDPLAKFILNDNDFGPAARDLVMCYLELLLLLPKLNGYEDLGQDCLFSPNMSVWCSNASPDYLSRTLSVFSELLQWQLKAKSVPALAQTVYIVAKDITAAQISRPRAPLTANERETLANLGVCFAIYDEDQLKTCFTNFAIDSACNIDVSKLFIQGIYELDNRLKIGYTELTQSWIRLVSIGHIPPYKMTREIMLNDAATLCENPSDLLKCYCEFVNMQKDWDREKVETLLNPLEKLCDKVFRSPDAHVGLIKPMINSCIIILRFMDSSKIYKAMMPCSSKRFITSILQIPVTVVTSSVLASQLPQLLVAIKENLKWNNDDYLKSRISQIITAAFSGFTKELLDRGLQEHPIYKILKNAVESNDTGILSLLGDLPGIASERVLGKYSEYLRTLAQISRHPNLAIVVLHSLPVLLRIVRLSGNNADAGLCADVISKFLEQDSLTETHWGAIQAAIYSEMSSRMSLHWRKYLRLFRSIVQPKNMKSNIVKRNVRTHLMDKIRDLVHICEAERGSGSNAALQEELRRLESEVA